METAIKKWGNSQGVRIPKELLVALNWEPGEEVNLKARDGGIFISRSLRRKNINELFAGFTDNDLTKEFDWGEPQGDEVW